MKTLKAPGEKQRLISAKKPCQAFYKWTKHKIYDYSEKIANKHTRIHSNTHKITQWELHNTATILTQ